MTETERLQAERDGLHALLSEVVRILHKWDHPYSGAHGSNCVHAIGELRALLLEPAAPTEEPDDV